MSQYQEKAAVARVEQFSATNIRLTLDCPNIARVANPGQFVMIRTGLGKDPLLSRPFSIHQTTSLGQIQIYFKVVGRGTEILAHIRKGEILTVFGPLGHGFRIKESAPACLVGGGLGIAPLFFLAKRISQIKKDCSQDMIIIGGRSRDEIEPLVEDFKQIGLPLACATDDGSYGFGGLVTELFVNQQLPRNCSVYCCGPEAMMAGIAGLCQERDLPCQVSVESVMACGMGACLGCSKPTKSGEYAHVCIDGPVFDAEVMVWNI